MKAIEIAKKLFKEKTPATRTEAQQVIDNLPHESSREYQVAYGNIDQLDIHMELSKMVRAEYFSGKSRIEWFKS